MALSVNRANLFTALAPLAALVLTCGFFATQSDRFLSGQNFSLILQQVMVVGVLAIGQTLIVLTAGIDLSCGAVMALAAIVMTKATMDYGLNPLLGMGLGILTAMAFGLANGLLVTRVKLPPFIVTLGTWKIATAVTLVYSGAETINKLPELLTWFGNSFPLGSTVVSYGTLALLALYGVVFVYLRETAPGRHIFAVGNNPEAARLTGIPTNRVLLKVYVLASVFYGLAAILLVARIGAGDPNSGQSENLDAITAVVLGGTSLFGGRGMILGSLVGAIIVGVFQNGLTLMGVQSEYQLLVTGVLVIIAVAADQAARKR